jgi:glycosyltransferase 2 family protein
MASAPARAAAHAPLRHPRATRPWWPWLKRALTLVFFVLVAWLLVRQARTVEWGEVAQSVQRMPVGHLLAAVALAAASYAVYCTYDLLGRHYTGHTLGQGQVLAITFISYAFNLNMGSLVGGIGFRIRMYSKLGLDSGTIGRVLSLSLVTNWLGYLLLAGLVFMLRPLELPPDWKLDSGGLRLLGAALVGVAFAYLAMCAFSSQRSFTVRGHTLELPSLRFALLQMTLSAINWLLIATIVHTLLQQRIDFPHVLSVMLIAAVAGVITHVPAGLGVLEAVFVALLSHRVPQGELLAALLTYRAIYYLGPLVLATIAFLVVEARAKKLAASSPTAKKG